MIAVNEYRITLKEVKPTVFGIVKNLINSVLIREEDEKKRKEEIERVLQNVYRVKDKFIGGCKSLEIQHVVGQVFGIEKETDSMKPHLKQLPPNEIYRYYCYMERLAKSPYDIKGMVVSESGKRKANQAKREEERIRKQHEQRMSSMTREELLEYEIFKGKDMEYFQKLGECEEEKELIASILKKYWISNSKWEGDKISKKQLPKIEIIKEILGEGVKP